MVEHNCQLNLIENLAQVLNPVKWEELFLVFAIKRCWLLWSKIGIPLEFQKNPAAISEWAVEVLENGKTFDDFIGTKQEFLSKWTDFWETALRDSFKKIIQQYGLENTRQLYHWCYWQGGIGFPLQFPNKQQRNSTESILDAWGCVIIDLIYHYNNQSQCEVEECPDLPPEILDWVECAEDLQHLKELPQVVPDFRNQDSPTDKDLLNTPLMLPAETINLIRQTMLNHYVPDPGNDDDRVAEMLAGTKAVPLDPRELELLKYIGTEYSSDKEDATPRRVEKYTDLDLTLKTLFRYHRVYSVVMELQKLLKGPEKTALIDWGRKVAVYPPFGNPNALLWPSEVNDKFQIILPS